VVSGAADGAGAGGGLGAYWELRKHFFFEKKKQKTFDFLGFDGPRVGRSKA